MRANWNLVAAGVIVFTRESAACAYQVSSGIEAVRIAHPRPRLSHLKSGLCLFFAMITRDEKHFAFHLHFRAEEKGKLRLSSAGKADTRVFRIGLASSSVAPPGAVTLRIVETQGLRPGYGIALASRANSAA